MTEQQLTKQALGFFTKWVPERWVEKNTPAYEEAREIRLAIARLKRAKKK